MHSNDLSTAPVEYVPGALQFASWMIACLISAILLRHLYLLCKRGNIQSNICLLIISHAARLIIFLISFIWIITASVVDDDEYYFFKYVLLFIISIHILVVIFAHRKKGFKTILINVVAEPFRILLIAAIAILPIVTLAIISNILGISSTAENAYFFLLILNIYIALPLVLVFVRKHIICKNKDISIKLFVALYLLSMSFLNGAFLIEMF